MINEKLKESIKYYSPNYQNSFTVIKGHNYHIQPLLDFAEQVLKVEGLPEKKECFVVHRPKDYTCPSCEMFHSCPHCLEAEGFNEAIDQCKLIVAKEYIHKSRLLDIKLDIGKIEHLIREQKFFSLSKYLKEINRQLEKIGEVTNEKRI